MTSVTKLPPCQLYLISPLDVSGAFSGQLRTALAAAPVAAFQFRVKDMDQHDAARLAEPLQEICAEHDTAFIVNDSISLAARLGADGVHLGQGDGDIADARARLGKDVQIGVTCHDSRHLALEAGEAGADYVAFGAFFPSPTKPGDYAAKTDLLRWWAQFVEIPSVAIGGITVDNCRPLVEAGADFLAVSSGVWAHDEGAGAAVQGFADIFSEVAKARLSA